MFICVWVFKRINYKQLNIHNMISPHSPTAILEIIMFYKNTTAIVCSWDGEADFFDIVTRVLQGDT